MNKQLNIIAWIMQGLLVAYLLYDTLDKVVGTNTAVAVFEKIGTGSFGRNMGALIEVACITCLMVPRFFREGTILAILICATGVFFHLTELGIRFYGDGGMRFYLTLTGLILAIVLFFIRSHLAFVLYKNGRL